MTARIKLVFTYILYIVSYIVSFSACLFLGASVGNVEINDMEYRKLQEQVSANSDSKQYMSYLYKANEDGVIDFSEFRELLDIASACKQNLSFSKEKASLMR